MSPNASWWCAASLLLVACGAHRPPGRVTVPGGSYLPGLTEAEREQVLAVCRAASGAEACGEKIFHDELTGAAAVELRPFAIDRLEVSQRRYRDCVAASACPALDRDLLDIPLVPPVHEVPQDARHGRALRLVEA
jgi:formylglycine-generating enzyme required for sulfatase activity